MKKSGILKRNLCFVSAVMWSGLSLQVAYAAPGTLSDSPLFLTNYPQPNIFFMLDDSGSMDWEIMVSGNGGRFASNQPDGTTVADAGAIQQRVTAHSGSGDCASGGYSGGTYIYGVEFDTNTYGDGSADCNTADDQAWRFRNVDFNPLYFDPSKDYTPWKGKNALGQDYQDVPITSAPNNPYNYDFASPPGSFETIDLTSHNSNWAGGTTRDTSDSDSDSNPDGFWFYTWSDTDSDGNFDNGEETGYQIRTVTSTQITAAGWKNPDGSTKSVADLQQDFANWFSYYRSREYVLKRAVSELVYDSQARMGLATLHDHNSVGVTVKDVDNISTPIDATAQANKTDLLSNLFQITSSNGTPLRIGLRNVGNYFDNASTTGVNDLFGTSTAPSSPILSAADGGMCQQNFVVLMTDGFWNGNSPGVGNTDEDGAGDFDGGSYADTVSNTLADVAMKYYESDLNTSLTNKVPVTAGVDENKAQHLVTFGVAFGVNGTLTANPPDRTSAFAWPTPVADANTTIDDLRHAGWNGRGGFLSAGKPQELIDSLSAAISEIGKRTGSASAVSFNSTSLQTNTKVYQAKFDSGGWHGDLRAIELTATGLGSVVWEAGGVLDARNLTTDPRQIFTYNQTQSSGVAFKWPSNYTTLGTTDIDSNQVNDMLANAPYASTTTDTAEIAANQIFGNKIVEYLRGDDTNEGTNTGDLRARSGHRLGDIIHSGPIYVGAPSTPYPDTIEGISHKYSTFANTQASRAERVYVGSNDGMLHGFDVASGRETMAYLPSILFSDQSGSGLHQLADQNYVHDYFVDLSPTVADYFNGTNWKTILIGGLRGGGKGLFALDITNPSGLTEANASNVVLWEYTHADLGYTFSEVKVGRLNNGKWAAIFGNGYNSTGDGKAKLFIYYLDGTTPTILDTGAGSIVNSSCADASSDCNGLSTPAIVDLNGDGNIDRVYAGDLHGNMWVWNLTMDTSSSPSTWNPRPAFGTAASPIPLFKACTASTCTTANRQPITTKPAIARHPTKRSVATAPNLMVFFGTGQYLVSSDNSSTGLQRFYGVWDGGWSSGLPLDMDDLATQTFSETTYDPAGPNETTVRTLSSNSVDYTTKKGWRIDLPTSKERMVVTPIALGDLIFFNTMIPETDTCSQGGQGWLLAANMQTGGSPDFTVIDVNGDGVVDAADKVGSLPVVGVPTGGVPTESRFLPNKDTVIRVTTDSSGTVDPRVTRAMPATAPGRMSWTGVEY